jgi:hypothetical protein
MLVSTHHEFKGKNKLGWIFMDVQMFVFRLCKTLYKKSKWNMKIKQKIQYIETLPLNFLDFERIPPNPTIFNQMCT